MIEGEFAVAFAAGMVAVANPCGFAMLPAYLSFFLGLEGQDEDARASVSRAIRRPGTASRRSQHDVDAGDRGNSGGQADRAFR